MSNETHIPDPDFSSDDEVGEVRQRGISRFLVLGIGLFIFVSCVVLILVNPPGLKLPQAGSAPTPVLPGVPFILASDTISRAGTLYLILSGAGNWPDIYSQLPASTTLVNLTNSAGIAETLPVISPSGASLAYYGIRGQGIADLYVIKLPDGRGLPITTSTGKTKLHDGFEIDVSQPPIWSPREAWLAFLVRQVDQKGNAVELYVIRPDSSDLQAITVRGNRVSNPVWLNDDEIAYVEQRGDGQANVYRHKIGQPQLSLTPLAVLPSP